MRFRCVATAIYSLLPKYFNKETLERTRIGLPETVVKIEKDAMKDEKISLPKLFTVSHVNVETMQLPNTIDSKSFAEILEEEWVDQSEELEEKHFDAAFEAKVAEIDTDTLSSTTTFDTNIGHQNILQKQLRPKKSNCYSPYVPSNASRIQGMLDFIKFYHSDVFCDMGCGDGRVCFVVAAAQYLQHRKQQPAIGLYDKNASTNQFRAVGIDVSADCIDMARKHLIANQYLSQDIKDCITFYQADLTIHPNEMLSGMLLFNLIISIQFLPLFTC